MLWIAEGSMIPNPVTVAGRRRAVVVRKRFMMVGLCNVMC